MRLETSLNELSFHTHLNAPIVKAREKNYLIL